MAPAAKIAQARELRERGVHYNEIAAELGVATSTIYRWVNPESAEQHRRTSRRAKARRRAPCARCGRRASYEKAPGALCHDCELDVKNATVYETIAELWRAGRTYAEIAAVIGVEPDHHIDRMRRRGWNLERRMLPTDAGAVRARERMILALRARGVPNREIAARIGTSLESFHQMLHRMRQAGVAPLARDRSEG
jgi:transposase